MATAEQIKALLRSHVAGDDTQFDSVALQLAAREAHKGHHRVATELKSLIEEAQTKTKPLRSIEPTQIRKQPVGDLSGLLAIGYDSVRKNELVLSQAVTERLDRVILEQRQKDKLNQHGLSPRRKLLFTGAPGTGKTMSASVLATELRLPLYTIVLDSLITRFMGETAGKLRLIFDHIQQTRAVYLFDEFDAIGTQRGANNDVGEVRRILNSFLMFMEQDKSESVIVAATNHPELLDKALYRRFDDIIPFSKPEKAEIELLIKNSLSTFDISKACLTKASAAAEGLSAAEITRACHDAAKVLILEHDSTSVPTELLVTEFNTRKNTGM